MSDEIQAGDIVQITDDAHHWFPALIVVTEPKAWGIQGCALIPQSNEPGARASQAFIRLKREQFERVGHAAIVPGE